jgi:hypothetical protein
MIHALSHYGIRHHRLRGIGHRDPLRCINRVPVHLNLLVLLRQQLLRHARHRQLGLRSAGQCQLLRLRSQLLRGVGQSQLLRLRSQLLIGQLLLLIRQLLLLVGQLLRLLSVRQRQLLGRCGQRQLLRLRSELRLSLLGQVVGQVLLRYGQLGLRTVGDGQLSRRICCDQDLLAGGENLGRRGHADRWTTCNRYRHRVASRDRGQGDWHSCDARRHGSDHLRGVGVGDGDGRHVHSVVALVGNAQVGVLVEQELVGGGQIRHLTLQLSYLLVEQIVLLFQHQSPKTKPCIRSAQHRRRIPGEIPFEKRPDPVGLDRMEVSIDEFRFRRSDKATFGQLNPALFEIVISNVAPPVHPVAHSVHHLRLCQRIVDANNVLLVVVVLDQLHDLGVLFLPRQVTVLAEAASAQPLPELVADRLGPRQLVLARGLGQNVIGHDARVLVLDLLLGGAVDELAVGSRADVVLEVVAEIQRLHFGFVLVLAVFPVADATDEVATNIVFLVVLALVSPSVQR